MNRRAFLSLLSAGAAGAVLGAELDLDRLLWVPKPIITVPAMLTPLRGPHPGTLMPVLRALADREDAGLSRPAHMAINSFDAADICNALKGLWTNPSAPPAVECFGRMGTALGMVWTADPHIPRGAVRFS